MRLIENFLDFERRVRLIERVLIIEDREYVKKKKRMILFLFRKEQLKKKIKGDLFYSLYIGIWSIIDSKSMNASHIGTKNTTTPTPTSITSNYQIR